MIATSLLDRTIRAAAAPLLLILALLGVACDARAQDGEPPDDARYVASTRGQVYYWIGCDAWRRLAEANRIYFPSAARAEAAGYRPSRTRGCGPRPGEVTTAEGRSGEAAAADGAASLDPAGDITLPPPSRPDAPTLPCTVTRIVDGDTIRCREIGSVRLLLIDTPELAQRPYGQAARAVLEARIPVGTTVRLEFDVQERDRYGRVLAYVYDPEGHMVNETLALSGYAVVLVYPPNVKHVERMREAVATARETGRGLWATPAFECTPADYRRGRCGE